MTQIFTARVTAVLLTVLLGLAPAALAQSTMVRGKVIDAKKQPHAGRHHHRRIDSAAPAAS